MILPFDQNERSLQFLAKVDLKIKAELAVMREENRLMKDALKSRRKRARKRSARNTPLRAA